jgi:glycosyltransferase involved in cell wall biosynthesis
MRVMHIVSGRFYGGVETLLVTLARCRTLSAAMEPEFALCFDGRLREELAETGAPVHLLGEVRARHPVSVMRARRQLRDLLTTRSVDVVVCHLPWTEAVFGTVARRAGVPLVFWMHGPANGRGWLERWAALTPPDAAICNSKYTAKSLPMIFPGIPFDVIYLPVKPSEPARQSQDHQQDRLQVRREFDTPPEATVVVQVSRFERWKGQLIHLAALAQLREVPNEGPNWFAWFVGGAQRADEVAYGAEVKAAASALGIGSRVRFVGERPEVAKILAASDIFCQPNIEAEPFGIAFIEALQAGLPVVASASGGALEVIDSSCGILVAAGKSEAVAEALRKLIEDSDLRGRLGAAGPARARQLTDPAAQMSRIAASLSRSHREGRLPAGAARSASHD